MSLRGFSGWLLVLVVMAVAGCHEGVPPGLDAMPLSGKIGVRDKFYDVQALDAERAVIVGYGGKILRTADGGASWELLDSGTHRALYDVQFVNESEGWICGQRGLILHTTDGGQTWERQQSGTVNYLFALDFLNDKEGWVVGDRAMHLHTVDGGRTWRQGKLAERAGSTAEEALLEQDPVLYDVQFVDRKTGWIVGEFGKIYHTADAGYTWAEQQQSLLGQDGVYNLLDLPTFFGVNFADSLHGIVAGLEGRVARTNDGGKTWAFERFDVEVPVSDPLFRPLMLADGTSWVAGAAGAVVRQGAAGQPWRRASLGMEANWLRGMDFSDPQNGWLVGAYGLILHTTDGGQSWLVMLG